MDPHNNDKRNWIVRVYRDSDEDQLFELYRALYPGKYGTKDSWLNWWNWQYKEYPFGVVTHIAEDEGKIIGHVSSVIIDMKMGNDMVKGRLPIGYAVHPDYRNKRVASMVTTTAFDYFLKNNNSISYGVPNKSGYALAIKQGYLDVGHLKRMTRVCDWESLFGIYIRNKLVMKFSSFCVNIFYRIFFQSRKPPDVNGLVIKKVTSFDERINEFLSANLEKFKIARIKNMDYLNWRYTKFTKSMSEIYIAERAGAICGYLALYKQKKEQLTKALICEFLFESESIARSIIFTVSEQCKKEHVSWISWAGLADKTYFQSFKKQGFFSFSFRNQLEFIVICPGHEIPDEFLKNPDNWLIQQGDIDV